MSEINKIDLIKPDIKLKVDKNAKQNIKADNAFEEQLLQTVEKLENMGNEIDAIIEQSSINNTNTLSSGVNKAGNYIKSIAGIVEKLSSEHKTNLKPDNFGIKQYEKMKNNS